MTYLLWACDMVRLLCGGFLCGVGFVLSVVGLRCVTGDWGSTEGRWRVGDFLEQNRTRPQPNPPVD